MKIIGFFKNLFKRKTKHIEVKNKPRGYDPKLALSVLIKAKTYYEHDSAFFGSGMCLYMRIAYIELTKECPLGNTITTLIPEFNYKFLGGKNKAYWWDIEDSESRLKAFDKLDTDKYQQFVCIESYCDFFDLFHDIGHFAKCITDRMPDSKYWRKATVKEIIEHFTMEGGAE